MNNMPQMPGIPLKSDASQASPFAEDSEQSESDVSLDAPLHVKPIISNPDNDSSSQVPVRSVPRKGIEVVSTRKGFYNQSRIKEGTVFFIKSEDQFGDWFKCVDKFYEEKRLKFLKDKKAKK